MTLPPQILNVSTIVLPVFGLLLLGYLVARTRIVGEHVADGMSDYVFVLALPCILFRTVVASNLPPQWPWGYWLAYFGGVAVVWTLASLMASKISHRPYDQSVIAGFSAGQGNIVMIGVPLIIALLGQAGAVPIVFLLAVNLPLNILAATLLLEVAGGKGKPLPQALKDVVMALVRHPIVVGVTSGILIRSLGIPLPKPVFSVISAIADTATTTALVAMGMALTRYGIRGAPGLGVTISILKLIVHPALAWIIARAVGLDDTWTAAVVIFASVPTGVNGYLLAARYRTAVDIASAAIAFSTVAALFTVSLWLIFLGKG